MGYSAAFQIALQKRVMFLCADPAASPVLLCTVQPFGCWLNMAASTSLHLTATWSIKNHTDRAATTGCSLWCGAAYVSGGHLLDKLNDRNLRYFGPSLGRDLLLVTLLKFPSPSCQELVGGIWAVPRNCDIWHVCNSCFIIQKLRINVSYRHWNFLSKCHFGFKTFFKVFPPFSGPKYDLDLQTSNSVRV